jgi:hypothetical protein
MSIVLSPVGPLHLILPPNTVLVREGLPEGRGNKRGSSADHSYCSHSLCPFSPRSEPSSHVHSIIYNPLTSQILLVVDDDGNVGNRASAVIDTAVDTDAASDADPDIHMDIETYPQIQKPGGEVARPGRGGYNLEEALCWPPDVFLDFKVYCLQPSAYTSCSSCVAVP